MTAVDVDELPEDQQWHVRRTRMWFQVQDVKRADPIEKVRDAVAELDEPARHHIARESMLSLRSLLLQHLELMVDVDELNDQWRRSLDAMRQLEKAIAEATDNTERTDPNDDLGWIAAHMPS